MSKIHYISCHSVLEFDEVKLFTELGHDVFSNGAYIDPAGAHTLPRPGIPGMKYDENLATLARTTPKTKLPPELIEPFDMIIIMHSPEVLFQNWDRIKHKRVIWRTIGQSTGGIELRIQRLVEEGLEIVRYSPLEQNIANYAGGKKTIRFYKDPDEFKGWNGEEARIINFSQSLKGRRQFCHHDEIVAIMEGFDATVYGTGNEDLGNLNGGEMPFEKQKEIMRNARAYIYGGTWPANYTLSLIEAMMTGIPVIALGKRLAHIPEFEQFNFYEIPEIIQNGSNGFVTDDLEEARKFVENLLGSHSLAKQIGREGRKRAIQLFGRDTIAAQWKEYLG
jgi:glycosyltransferase involved in cell wall biosynthesis